MMEASAGLALDELEYHLPDALIAQEPAPARDGARLLVIRREPGVVEHRMVRDLPELLAPGDLLVLNESRVNAARIRLAKEGTGGRIDALLLERRDGAAWDAMVTGAGKLKPGTRLVHQDAPGHAVLEAVEPAGEGRWILRAIGGDAAAVERLGEPPLPPYINRPDGSRVREDLARYQTVYARVPGSTAAPTAGLHFTPELLAGVEQAGVETARVTLHVGPGTFMPIKAGRVEDHRMHPEAWSVTAPALASIRGALAADRRVVGVGTSAVRVLETLAATPGGASAGTTSLFITPGYRFAAVGAMLTNFHQPRSTPYALVAALAGLGLVRRAYAEAIDRRYRFLSYGDAMLIL
jgi:S-adenosylmethionine:tRNA ribosyltransferase-isomerase